MTAASMHNSGIVRRCIIDGVSFLTVSGVAFQMLTSLDMYAHLQRQHWHGAGGDEHLRLHGCITTVKCHITFAMFFGVADVARICPDFAS